MQWRFSIKDDEKRNNIILFIVSVACSAIIACLVYGLFGRPFFTNDEIVIRSILSGYFTGAANGHAVYLLAPLGYIIATFYRFIPAIQWYDLFQILLHLSSWVFISYGIGKAMANTLWKKLCISVVTLIFIVGVDACYSVYSQYTVNSALLMATSILYLGLFLIKQRKSYCIISIAFAFLSINVRKDPCLMLLPFCLLIVVLYLFDTGFKNVKKTVIYVAIMVGVIVATLAINGLAYNSPEWKTYLEFNANRTYIQDYSGVPMFQYAQAAYEANQMSDADYQAIRNQNISFADKYTLKASRDLKEAAKELVQANNSLSGVNSLLGRVVNAEKDFLIDPVGWGVCLIFICILVCAIIFKRYWHMLAAALAVCYKLMFYALFIYLDRLPERVSYGFCFGELVALITIFIMQVHGELAKKRAASFFMIFAVASVAFLTYRNGRVQLFRIDRNEDAWVVGIDEARALSEYTGKNADCVYLVSSDITLNLADRMINSGYNEWSNIFHLSYWTEKSPLFEKKKENRDISSLSEALIDRKDCYYIALETSGLEWLEYYYNDRGIKVVFEEVDRFVGPECDNIVYSISKVD